jgi:hypothetical protein
MLALLSIFRYVSIIHKHSSFNRSLGRCRGISVIICALISLCWSLPPLLKIENTYTNEGVGFYCSLDWNNSAFHSRLYIYSLLICNYFILLFVLIYSNLHVYFVLRRLLKSNKYINSSLVPTILHLAIVNIHSSTYSVHNYGLRSESRKRIFDQRLKRRLGRLQRLKIDQRYARITAIMVTQFLMAWTPYAILALIIINGHIELLRQYPILSTIAELLAKFSLILNPLIMIYTSQMRRH